MNVSFSKIIHEGWIVLWSMGSLKGCSCLQSRSVSSSWLLRSHSCTFPLFWNQFQNIHHYSVQIFLGQFRITTINIKHLELNFVSKNNYSAANATSSLKKLEQLKKTFLDEKKQLSWYKASLLKYRILLYMVSKSQSTHSYLCWITLHSKTPEGHIPYEIFNT